jgi:hypothetical protein
MKTDEYESCSKCKSGRLVVPWHVKARGPLTTSAGKTPAGQKPVVPKCETVNVQSVFSGGGKKRKTDKNHLRVKMLGS